MAKNLEKTYGVELPRLRDPDATKFFSPARLKEINAQGLDIVKAAERVGYTVQMPKNAMTINEFTKLKPVQIKSIVNKLVKAGFRCAKAEGEFVMIQLLTKNQLKNKWLKQQMEIQKLSLK